MSVAVARPTAWVLNLDAEEELADPRGHTRGGAMQRRLGEVVTQLQGLVGEHDIVLDGIGTGRRAEGLPGEAWCPTPRALSALRAAGALTAPAPSVEILRRVNDRRFAVTLDAGPLNSRYVSDIEAVKAVVAGAPGASWVLKRALSFAGRGHRRIVGALDAVDCRWCANAFRHGLGVVVEPWVERECDFAQHGWVTQAGTTQLGRPLVQLCDARGAWQKTLAPGGEPGHHLTAAERTCLADAALGAGVALAAAGYFGPFGIDAFRYRDGARTRFNPMVEINARYGMGWGLAGCERGGP